MMEWFKENPVQFIAAMCVCLLMSSCTGRHIYCEWNECQKQQTHK